MIDTDKLRALPIEAVAAKLGLNVRRHMACCVWHDDHNPSMHFNTAKNKCHCFSCGHSGGVFDLVMAVNGLDFKGAARWLEAESVNGYGLCVMGDELGDASSNHQIIASSDHHQATHNPSSITHNHQVVDTKYLTNLMQVPWLTSDAQRFLYDQRHIDPRVVRWLGISSIALPTPTAGYKGCLKFEAPALLIPYRDVDGNLLSVQSRYLGRYRTRDTPRFRFPLGDKPGIFNQPILKMLAKGEDLYIAEGSTDCMAMLTDGHKAIAIPSATLLSAADRALLAQYLTPEWGGTLHVFPDQDDAGTRLFTQLVQLANDLHVPIVGHDLPEGCKDYADYYVKSRS